MSETEKGTMTANNAAKTFVHSQRFIISNATLETYEHLLKRFVIYFDGRKMEDITTADLRDYRTCLHSRMSRNGKPYSPATVFRQEPVADHAKPGPATGICQRAGTGANGR